MAGRDWSADLASLPLKQTDYSTLADIYGRHRQADPEVLARLTAGLDATSRVLELGCGTGNYVTALRSAAGCECVGIDASPQMLAKLKARSSEVQAVDGRAERLPFGESSFDLVFSVDVIHHIEDRNAAFREAARVLKEGGRLCIVSDSEATIRQREPLAEYFPEIVEVELARYPNIETLRMELGYAGFEELRAEVTERVQEISDSAPFREKAFSSLQYLSNEAFEKGLAKLEARLKDGPLSCTQRAHLLWATKPPELDE
jgi:ubiquinone/menaquinone biosynthesis C-methylase UbiE